MNRRQRKTFALFFLVKVLGFPRQDALDSIEFGMDLWQLDEIAEEGMYAVRLGLENYRHVAGLKT